MHIKQHSLADSRRNIVLCYTQVRTHLSSLEPGETQRASIIRLHCKKRKQCRGCRWLMTRNLFKTQAAIFFASSTPFLRRRTMKVKTNLMRHTEMNFSPSRFIYFRSNCCSRFLKQLFRIRKAKLFLLPRVTCESLSARPDLRCNNTSRIYFRQISHGLHAKKENRELLQQLFVPTVNEQDVECKGFVFGLNNCYWTGDSWIQLKIYGSWFSKNFCDFSNI